MATTPYTAKKQDEWEDAFAFTNNNKHRNNGPTNTLTTLCKDLLVDKSFEQMAFGRIDSIYEIMQIMVRNKKPNVIILGEAGVGKTALIQGLAYCFNHNNVVNELKNYRLLSLDLNQLKSGSCTAGTIEQKLIELEQMIKASKQPIIFFIDEIHQIATNQIHNQAIVNFLKPHLTTNFIRIIGATTNSEYQKYFLKDKALVRRFQTLVLNELDQVASVNVLKTLIKSQYPKQLTISDDNLKYLVTTSSRYLPNRQLPDSAIDVFDQAFALAKLKNQPVDKFALSQEIDYLTMTNQSVQIKAKKDQLDQYLTNQDRYEHWDSVIKSQMDLIEKLVASDYDPKNNGHHEAISQELTNAANVLNEARVNFNNCQKQDEQIKNEPIEIDKTIIDKVVSTLSGVNISQDQNQSWLTFGARLKKLVIGQDAVIERVNQQLTPYFFNLHHPQKPIASFLFTGSTGIGKTELAKAIAKTLFNNDRKLLKIDMSEYDQSHHVSKLIGTSAGYIGYGETNQLASFVMANPHSVILFDEIDKAHPNVLNLLLQILDEGILTDGQNNKVNFKNTIIIMCANWCHEQSQLEVNQDVIKRTLARIIKPELVNRIDQILNFKALNEADLATISQMHCATWANRIEAQYGIKLGFDQAVYRYLANQGFDQQFGARYLKQVIDQQIINLVIPLLNEIKRDDKQALIGKNQQVVVNNNQLAIIGVNQDLAFN